MKCWNCEEETMVLAPELGRDWSKCSSCGATDIKNPTTGKGGDLISVERSISDGATKFKLSGSVASRAAKARKAKANK